MQVGRRSSSTSKAQFLETIPDAWPRNWVINRSLLAIHSACHALPIKQIRSARSRLCFGLANSFIRIDKASGNWQVESGKWGATGATSLEESSRV